MASNPKIAKKIEEVVRPYCNSEWCILKEMLVCSHSDARYFVQLKCIEHLKFELSEKIGYDVGWEASHLEWVANGYARLFAEYYDEDLTAEHIYEKLIKKIPLK